MSDIRKGSEATTVSWLAGTAGIAVAYFAAGRLALLLAIPPGYSAAFWPAAGIALAGTLLFGYRAWLGVLVGSALVTLSTSFDFSSLALILESTAVAAGIAAGAVLQAVLGAFLVRRFVGISMRFVRLGKVGATMALGGPMACLTSATVGVTCLLLAGSIEAAEFARNWGTWWVGDSTGVLVIIPLMFLWERELEGTSPRARSLVSVPILVAFAITVVGFFDTRERELERAQADFGRRAEMMARTLEQSVLAEVEIIQSIVNFFEASVAVERAEFRTFVEPNLARHHDIHGLSWNAIVSGDDRAAFESAVRQDGLTDFFITERGAEGELVRARDRDEYVVVSYIEPAAGNEQALGFALNSDPVRARALAEAGDTGRIVATPPITLVQETEHKKGLLLVAPVYRKDLPRETLTDRRRNLHSFVSGVFRAEEMVAEALAVFLREDIDYKIVDTTDPENAIVLFGDRVSSDELSGIRADLRWTTDILVGGRQWTMSFWPSPDYSSAGQWERVWAVLVGGLLFTGLLGAFLLVAVGRAAAAERSSHELRRESEERRRVEEALITSERRFRAVFENAAVGVALVDAHERLLNSNAALQKMLGYSGEELAAMKFAELTHPEDLDADVTLFGELQSGIRTHYEVEKRYITKGGDSVWGHLAVSLVRDPDGQALFSIGINQDITKRKLAEEALLYTQFSVDHAVDGIFWVEQDGHFSYVNAAACEMTGYPRETLLTKTVFDIDPNFSRPMWPEFWQSVRNADNEVIETTILRSDGAVFPSEVAIKYLEVDGAGRCIASMRDSTERIRGEQERLEFETRMQQAQKLESMGLLAGGIAHDFNNLLVGVLGNADVALAKLSPTSPARDYLRDIETTAQRAADLANQLLAYSGKGKFVVEPIDLSDLVSETAHLVEISVSKKIEVKYDLAEDLPAIEADVTQIRQVVLNLITNASEATGGREGVVSLTTGQLESDSDDFLEVFPAESPPRGTYVFLEVADTGSGMDEETQKRIFDPFFTTKLTGRGLGLAAVLGIVRGHKGAIKVASEPGRGTTITVLVPASKESVPRVRGKENDDERWEGEGTVLLVDDEAVVRQVGSRMLTLLGFEVLMAEDGVRALEIYRERADDIVLVVLDLAMPRMSGEETFAELRRIKADVKVLLSSGYSEQDTTAKFAGKRLAGFVQKPYRLDVFRDKIRSILEG